MNRKLSQHDPYNGIFSCPRLNVFAPNIRNKASMQFSSLLRNTIKEIPDSIITYKKYKCVDWKKGNFSFWRKT